MNNISKIVVYVIKNRRTIGVIVGGLMTLLGFGDFSDPMAQSYYIGNCPHGRE